MKADLSPLDILRLFQEGCLIEKARNKYHEDGSGKLSRAAMRKNLRAAFPKITKEKLEKLLEFEMDDYDPLTEFILKPHHIDLSTVNHKTTGKTTTTKNKLPTKTKKRISPHKRSKN
ncbi:MAG: hypothetical protein J6Y94_08930 [Bacteriovoracaceae bacterium]|nr:hypothetical protein [Bacteriovoracaceae bacterium]